MVKFIAGEKGVGKTKKLIEMANTAVKDSQGHIVFIESDNRHMYDLHYDVRFVETSDYPLSNYRELIGFLYGIISQDSDIEKIYIDGLSKVINTLPEEDLIKLVAKLKRMSEKYSIEFFTTINVPEAEVPEEIKDSIIQ